MLMNNYQYMYTVQGKLLKPPKKVTENFETMPNPTYPVGGDILLVTNDSCYWTIDRMTAKPKIIKNQKDFSKCYMLDNVVNDSTSTKISQLIKDSQKLIDEYIADNIKLKNTPPTATFGTTVAVPKVAVPKVAVQVSIRIEDTFNDGIPINLLSQKHRFAFCVTPRNNKFIVNQCYKINEIEIKVIRIDKNAHYQKDVIHFSIPSIEAKFKPYSNATFESIGC